MWIYLVEIMGGYTFLRPHAGKGAEKAKRWVQRNAFLSAFIPAILPPPFPFKVFVLAEGVFQVPLRTFSVSLLLGRGLRYFAEGILAVRYGAVVLLFMMAHRAAFAFSIVISLLVLYLATRLLFHDAPATR